MFNFHKPRTYRSAEGCCICRAKSSSSRFTDSRKYERDTMLCFDLKYPRQGEICNACVLLVKRYKRLPVDSKRNWSHVVDARAGPGGSKIQTKYKSERISSRTHQQSVSNNTALTSPTSSSSCVGNSSAGGSPNATVHGHPMSFLPEKFSKIFKKSKKVKESSLSSSLSTSHYSSAKRKSSSNGWSSHNGIQAHPTAPDSLDSDYEDSRMHSSLVSCGPGSATVVHFQTQTRASAFKAQAAAEARRRTLKLGSKRRKCLRPRKNRRTTTLEETLQFFDEEEWREQKSCCGMLYECPSLGGALIVDVANYKPCEKHQQIPTAAAASSANASIDLQSQSYMPLVMPPQRPIIHHSIPAVVQLQPPAAPTTATLPLMTSGASSNSALPSSIILGTTSTPSALTITKSTPVLKKHHLFYKRQSECFPQGDMVTPSEMTTNYSSSSNPVHNTKTESDYNNRTQHQLQQQQHQQYKLQHPHHQSTTIFQRHNEHAIHSSSAAAPSNYAAVSSSGALSISVTSVAVPSSASSSPMPMSTIPSSSLFTSTMPQMPKHSLAKVTTISPPLTASHTTINTSMPLSKPHSFLHKIKADTGKIVKHSLEKFNTAVRLKTNDLHDMKPIIKTVDKSYILAKPPTMANINSLNGAAAAVTTYQTLSSYNSAAQPPLTTASLSAASPTSSTSSTSSTKFSDNSSDSGFDENMLDRKSASPLQEDCEKKLLSRPGVQTMFLASGVQIQGQPQNLVLTGNEVAAKILQNRKYSSITTTPVTSNTRALSTNHHHHPTTTPVKIAQISTGAGGGVVGSHHSVSSSAVMSSAAAQAKMRAIYNNSNTIQHENGITTIVPASSLAATTQMAAMQNIAPSTVTITPAPPVAGNTQYNGQNIISRKLTTANIINLQSNNLSNTTTTTNLSGNNGGNHFNSASASNQQKIILLKTPSPNSNGMTTTSSSLSLSSTTATVTKYSGR